jgi:CYTH domain-containing protein
MDKTSHTLIRRSFLTEGLPEPLTPASSHLQLFDNYIPNTRLRIRNIRVPETKEWRHALQQVYPIGDRLSVSTISLNDEEYAIFTRFEGREIRKNRYFHEFDGREFTFDVFLSGLWGLTIAKVEFRNREEAEDFDPPPFAVFEITGNEFFLGSSLVEKRFEDVREEIGKMERSVPVSPRSDQE